MRWAVIEVPMRPRLPICVDSPSAVTPQPRSLDEAGRNGALLPESVSVCVRQRSKYGAKQRGMVKGKSAGQLS